MRHFISLSFILLLTSCANITTNHYPQTVNSWRGANVQNLNKIWGTPDSIMKTKDGNTVYVYKSSGCRPGVISGPPDCTAIFETNKQNIVVHTQYQGKRCWRDASFARQMSNPN